MNIARDGVSEHIPLGVQDSHAAGNARGTNIITAILGVNASAGRGEPNLAANVFAANGSGNRRCLHGAADVANDLRAGDARRIDFGIAGNFYGIADRDIVQARGVFTDAESVASEFDRRVGNEVVQTALRIAETESGDAHITVNVDFAVGATDDGDVTSDVTEFDANGTGDIQGTLKTAGDGGAHLAAG